MTIEERNIIWLDTFEFLSYQKKVKILSLFAVDENIVQNFDKRKYELFQLLNQNEYNTMFASRNEEQLDELIDKYIHSDIKLITIYSNCYILRGIP